MGLGITTDVQQNIKMAGKAKQFGMHAYQREGCANPQEVIDDGKAENVRVFQHVEKALSFLDRCVERRPLVVACKGAQLNDEVDHKAHCVDQVWLKVRIWLLHLILHH